MSMLKYFAAAVVLVCALFLGAAWLSGRGVQTLDQAVYAAAPTAPELIGKPTVWLNTDGKALKLYGSQGILQHNPYAPGKKAVVLTDFWEYTCVNCIRTLPYVKEWAARYKSSGLVVVGVHTPEFAFAHDEANVAAATRRFGITYPVLVDSGYENWNAFNNDSWPMKYVIDPDGKIVYTHAGEGGYGETEQRLRELLLKANPGETLPAPYGDHEVASDAYDMTAELYGGSSRTRLQNPEGVGFAAPVSYAPISPSQWQDGQLVLSGRWTFADEYVQPSDTSGPVAGVRYHALESVAVIRPATTNNFKVYVTQDGQPVQREDAGSDLKYEPDGRSYLLIDAPREYQITRNKQFGEHTLALNPTSASFRLYELDFSPT